MAVGRARQGPERALYEHYVKRIHLPLSLTEISENRTVPTVENLNKSAEKISRAIPLGAKIITLDEQGNNLTSKQFAGYFQQWRDEGVSDLAFIIGGANGLDTKFQDTADFSVSFGRVTWPHLLARALLAEQLYRAQQILVGHPYHRE